MKKAKKRRPTGLVIGYLERVSSQVLAKFQKQIKELVGGKHGIYALYRNNKLYYVGLATKLRVRIKHHLKDRHKGLWTHFSLYLVKSEKHLKDLESLAIRIADPKGNKIFGKFGGAPDLLNELKRGMKKAVNREIEELLGKKGKRKEGKTSRSQVKTSGASKKKTKRALRKPRGRKSRKMQKASIPPLKGLLKNKRLNMAYRGETYVAYVLSSGRIKFDGKIYETPSGAAKAVTGYPSNGWAWWRYQDKKGNWVRLKTLKK